MRKYRQGIFKPKNPTKYKGDPTNIVYRSSWERITFAYLDENPNCISWQSEEFFIPYRSPVDDKIHRYFIDLKVTIQYPNNVNKTFLAEIKPYDQTLPPDMNKKRSKQRLLEEVSTYSVNQAKWIAAKKYCEDRGYHFIILTEYDIGLKKRHSS
jgi:hypothetical protein